MARFARLAVTFTAGVATMLAACSPTEDASCPPGFALCDATCLPVSSDPANCGACGNTCAAGQACIASQCVADCRAGLKIPVQDRWGTWWDGLERLGATFADAAAACVGLGGRLPTATETWRVSWARTADVGQSYQTNPLWTVVPYDNDNQFTFRMSDGSSTVLAVGAPQAYRCVCPADDPVAFTGYACQGPPGSECHALGGGNASYNLDAEDRAPLSKGAAMWECAYSGAALPSYRQLAEAILAGAPAGTNTYLHTADDARYDQDVLMRWTGVQTGWVADGGAGTSNGTMTDRRPFRCIGRASAAGATAPGGVFLGVGGKGADPADRASQGWAAAHSACFTDGGHLATMTELGALVQQGLPAGSGAWLWTSDQVGWNGVQFLGGVLRWTDLNGRFGHFHDRYVSWAYKTDAGFPFRCVYYPIDPSRTQPTAACNGGCTEIALGSAGARMWLDTQDRQQATFTAALSICANLGGHLANERDLTEAIRSGLPNGTGSLLHTSDVAVGQAGPLTNTVVRWTATDGNFSDQYSTYMTWGANLAESRPFRCVWTNELR